MNSALRNGYISFMQLCGPVSLPMVGLYVNRLRSDMELSDSLES